MNEQYNWKNKRKDDKRNYDSLKMCPCEIRKIREEALEKLNSTLIAIRRWRIESLESQLRY